MKFVGMGPSSNCYQALKSTVKNGVLTQGKIQTLFQTFNPFFDLEAQLWLSMFARLKWPGAIDPPPVNLSL